MSILDNYMFRPLLAIFRMSSRELKVLLYTLCAHVVQSYLHGDLLRNVIVPLVTAYQHIQKLHYAISPHVEISEPRACTIYTVGP